eukprot:Hpha_TRINITY_DN15445_c0_g2::TRINITY_DN15445_c0_g2_i1::g.175069::m.175069
MSLSPLACLPQPSQDMSIVAPTPLTLISDEPSSENDSSDLSSILSLKLKSSTQGLRSMRRNRSTEDLCRPGGWWKTWKSAPDLEALEMLSQSEDLNNVSSPGASQSRGVESCTGVESNVDSPCVGRTSPCSLSYAKRASVDLAHVTAQGAELGLLRMSPTFSHNSRR